MEQIKQKPCINCNSPIEPLEYTEKIDIMEINDVKDTELCYTCFEIQFSIDESLSKIKQIESYIEFLTTENTKNIKKHEKAIHDINEVFKYNVQKRRDLIKSLLNRVKTKQTLLKRLRVKKGGENE